MNSQEIANYFSKQYGIEVILEGVSLRSEDGVLYIPIVFPETEINSLLQACHLLSCRAKDKTKPPKNLTPWEKKTWRYFEDKRICKMDLVELYKSLNLKSAKGLDLFILKEYRKDNNIFTSYMPETKDDVLSLNQSFWEYLSINKLDLARPNLIYKESINKFTVEENSLEKQVKELRQLIANDKEIADYHKENMNRVIDSYKKDIKSLQSKLKTVDNKLDAKDIRGQITSLKKKITSERESYKKETSVKKLSVNRGNLKKVRESLKKLEEEKYQFLEKSIVPETPSIEEMYRETIYDYFRLIKLDNETRVKSFVEDNVLSEEDEEKLNIYSDIERYVCYTRRFDEESIFEAEEIKTPSAFINSKINYLLRKYFFGKKNEYEVKGLKRGKLDRFALHKRFTIFKEKRVTIKRQTAISIAINIHGLYEEQLLYAHSVAKFCRENDISCEVIGYYTQREELDVSFVPEDVLHKFNRVSSSLQTVVLKEFESNDIENIFSYEKPHTDGHCDNESLSVIGKRLLERREKRKILIVLSNNSPYMEEARKEILLSDLKLTVNELDLRKVEILAFGIKSSYGKSVYPNYFNVKNGEELLDVGVNEFCKLLLAKKKFYGKRDDV